MTWDWDLFMALTSLTVSVIVGIRTVVKSTAETGGLQAGTYLSYQKALEAAQKNYEDLAQDLQEVRKELDQIRYQNERLERHNRALTKQLADARITPVDINDVPGNRPLGGVR